MKEGFYKYHDSFAQVSSRDIVFMFYNYAMTSISGLALLRRTDIFNQKNP